MKGSMEGWQQDECTGRCGSCDRCEAALERNTDDAIERSLGGWDE